MEYKWVALSNTTLGVLMASLDTNIVLIALPTIGRELPGTSAFDLLWILLGYNLVVASVLINFGRLSDMFGRVRLYNFGFGIFTAGSALCSFSQTGEELVVFRLVQAIGGAFLFSNSAAIITDAFPLRERGKALGVNQVSLVVGSVVGLVLGGFLTQTTGWRSIFLVNVPVGIFATLWSHYRLKELGLITRGQKVDYVGNVTLVSGLALILAGITLFAIESVTPAEFYAMVVAGGIIIAIFIFAEARLEQPMFNLSLFKIRRFSAGNIAIFLNALARGAVSLVLVFYLQGPTMGMDPLRAGIFLVPMSVSLATFGPLSGWLSDRYGPRGLSTLGLVVSALGFFLLSGIGKTVTFSGLAPGLVLVGSGMGLFASPNRASIMNSVPARARGIASGASTTLVMVGNTFSLGLAFLIMSLGAPIDKVEEIFLGGTISNNVSWLGGFIDSIHKVYYLSMVVLLVAIVPSLLRGAPHEPQEGGNS